MYMDREVPLGGGRGVVGDYTGVAMGGVGNLVWGMDHFILEVHIFV